jgi:predicted transcriptional regulator
LTENDPAHIELAADIVAAYVRRNSITPADLPGLIVSVFNALAKASRGRPAEALDVRPVPAVPIKKSITPDYLISLEDGRKFKSLKRHLKVEHGMTPEQYRAKWGLPKNYSMLAPNSTATRSAIAKKAGLGRRVKKPG